MSVVDWLCVSHTDVSVVSRVAVLAPRAGCIGTVRVKLDRHQTLSTMAARPVATWEWRRRRRRRGGGSWWPTVGGFPAGHDR